MSDSNIDVYERINKLGIKDPKNPSQSDIIKVFEAYKNNKLSKKLFNNI